MDDRVVPGSRVKVRFAGQDVDGFVLERVAESDHPGRLAPLRRAVSAEPVLSPEVARLTGLVAARYAGTRSDVLRLAVPPRHATVEREEPRVGAPKPTTRDRAEPGARRGRRHHRRRPGRAAAWWARYPAGPALTTARAARSSRRRGERAAARGVDGRARRRLGHRPGARGRRDARRGRGSVLCVPDAPRPRPCSTPR